MRTACVFTVLAALTVPATVSAQATPAPVPQASPAKPATPSPTPPTPAPAQPPAPAPSPAPAAQTPPPPASAVPQPPPLETYVYRADGRRDPFLSLIGSGPDKSLTSRRGEGPSGMTLGEISVRGILQSRGSLVAMIQGPDNKTYIVHQGDKLLDGSIKTITPQGLIVIQEVNDPLSLVKQREVRKLLRSLEDAKE
jgi:Tfp pilus assembly protein PilP